MDRRVMRVDAAGGDDLTREDVYDALAHELDLIPRQLESDGFVAGIDFGKTNFASRLESFVEEVLKSNLPGYVVDGVGRMGRLRVRPLRLANWFSDVLRCDELDNTQHQFSEEAEIVISTVKSMKLDQSFDKPEEKHIVTGKSGYEIFNEVVSVVRVKLADPGFIRRRRRRRERAKRHFQSGVRYIGRLFDRYARLLVVRVDLGYKVNLNGSHPAASKAALSRTRRDLKRFQNNMRSNKLFEHVVGLVWKLEHGASKGYHYHLMIFCDGSEVRKDAYIAQQICNYWQSVVTEGDGVGYNCNRYKTGYRYCGIGMIGHSDNELRENLLAAFAYMAKSDQYLRIRTEGERTFGHWAAKERTGRSGRPRSLGMDDAIEDRAPRV